MASSGEKSVETIHSVVTTTWDRLNAIWNQVGYDTDNVTRRQNTVVKHVSELLEEMTQEAEDRLNEQQQKLDTLMHEILQLAKDLSMADVPELAEASGKPLLEMESVFVSIAVLLRKRKEIRMEKYNKINEQVIKICEELDEPPMKIEFEGIPADSQVEKLEQHLNYLHHEKSKRLGEYLKFKKSLIELFKLLEKSPRNDLEILVAESDEINLSHPISASGIKVLSQAILDKIRGINNDMTDELHANKEQGEKYWQKIRELWSRLSADEEMIMAFEQVHRSMSTETREGVFKPSVLKGLHKEVERLEEEKKQNMSMFIQQVRSELCDLWTSKCFMASVQDRFTESNYLGVTTFTIADFNSDVYTEDLLERHESEVEFWRGFVERNKKIIDVVVRRGHMFAQYKTLDQKSDDPSRLANRGGALLKEEKERKKLEKAIPKLESELKQLCDVFEAEADAGYGMIKFLVYGRTIYEMIEQDWEEFLEEKRVRKEAKKKPNEGGTTMMTTQMGNPGSRKRPHTPSSVQRTPLTPNKRNRTHTITTPGKTIQSPFMHPPPSSSSKRPLGNAPRPPKNKHNISNSIQYFRANMSSTQAASRKAVRRSIGKLRNASSLMSSSSSSSSCYNKSSLSQPNLKVSSMEQLEFSKVIRGPILEVIKAKQTTPKRSSSKENFAYPAPSGIRSLKKTPSQPNMLTRQASSGKIPLPTKLTGKEQVPPASLKRTKSKDTVVSPVASYSEFTDHLLCQSTLNSSAMVPLQSKTGPTTPTKSQPGMVFTAKLPLSDNCF